MQVLRVLRVHAWETNAHARVNLCQMSTDKSCWRWSVSQFSTCLSLLRHGCQNNSFWNSQTDSQNVHFRWPNERTICPDNGFQTPITAILSAHLLHEVIVNVKCRMDWSYRKPSCLSVNFFKQYSANGTCLTSVNMSPPFDLFEKVKFSLIHTEISWLVTLSLTGKRMNFPDMATMSHTNILRRSEIQMFFSNNRIEIGGHQ